MPTNSPSPSQPLNMPQAICMPPRKCDTEDIGRECKETAVITVCFSNCLHRTTVHKVPGPGEGSSRGEAPQPQPHCLPSQPTSASLVCSKGGTVKGVGVGGLLAFVPPVSSLYPSSFLHVLSSVSIPFLPFSFTVHYFLISFILFFGHTEWQVES